MENNFGIKELYHASLNVLNTTKIGNRIFLPGESLIIFNNVQLMELNEKTKLVYARGGRSNPALVCWESKDPVVLGLSQGTVTQTAFSILTGAKLITSDDPIIITKYEHNLELDDSGNVELAYTPNLDKPYFCYEEVNNCVQDKIDCTIVGKILQCGQASAGKNVMVKYSFDYYERTTIYKVDRRDLSAAFSFEGRYYSKSASTGLCVTNILTIPKVSVISNLRMTLGEKANPLMSTFYMTCLSSPSPEGNKVLDIVQLDTDVDSIL